MKHAIIVAALAGAMLLSGCGLATGAKDSTVVDAGTPRTAVLYELGVPVRTKRLEDGGRSDVFRFFHLYDEDNRLVRVVGHTIPPTPYVSLGMWQLVGDALKSKGLGELEVLDGSADKPSGAIPYHRLHIDALEVLYDSADRVSGFNILKDGAQFPPQEWPADGDG